MHEVIVVRSLKEYLINQFVSTHKVCRKQSFELLERELTLFSYFLEEKETFQLLSKL
jgi:hypothetical protein